MAFYQTVHDLLQAVEDKSVHASPALPSPFVVVEFLLVLQCMYFLFDLDSVGFPTRVITFITQI